MYVCVYYVFVFSCVYVAALRRADHPSKESYRLKLRSWVRIPLEAWMFVCVYSVFVLSCVYVAAL
jgi:amino acid transporter